MNPAVEEESESVVVELAKAGADSLDLLEEQVHGFGRAEPEFYLEATQEELVAKCPVHGHRPFNPRRMWER